MEWGKWDRAEEVAVMSTHKNNTVHYTIFHSRP